VQKDWDTPLAHTHFKAEGDVEFKAVMFLPSQAAPGERVAVVCRRARLRGCGALGG
jgi:HSP90 family molecular chaperone